MRSLFYLVVRYSALISFIILECIAFFLIINYNKSQREIWAHSSNLFTGSIYERVDNVREFFDLETKNDSLLSENAKLLETIINYRVNSRDNSFQLFENNDSITTEYNLIPASICNKTISLRNNYFTLCQGKNSGIEVGMGVISDDGIVGIVKAVSDNFSTVLLILNSQSRISAKIKSKNYYGNLMWQSSDTRIITLLDIPKHAEISVGDSVVTSGFSTIFPSDIFVGQISNYSLEGGSNNYKIDIELNSDVTTVEHVYVIKYALTEEKLELMSKENE